MEVKVSIIVSTYNNEENLQKVLWAYNGQTFQNFELIIADDGSDVKTELMLDMMDLEVFYPLIHVWQEDDGFQKSKILNKAILSCQSDYIIITDGDCIPGHDFVETHWKHKEKGCFLSGGHTKLPVEISRQITKNDILQQHCFSISWLNSLNSEKKIKHQNLLAPDSPIDFLNKIAKTKAFWNGQNASAWKEDLLSVNGFDERLHYGEQDRELGERLRNLGIKSKEVRFSAICVNVHQELTNHDNISMLKNIKIRKATKRSKATWTSFGIKQEEHPLETKIQGFY